jgi:hypothetical protein
VKWLIGVAVVLLLYVLWPYYALLELKHAIRTADAPTIKRLVDWDQLRANLKTEFAAYVKTTQQPGAKRGFGNLMPELTAARNNAALTFVSSMIDKTVTPEGIAGVLQTAQKAVQQAKTAPGAPKTDPGLHINLWQQTHYAFFVSPIQFRIDLSGPNRSGAAAKSTVAESTLTIMLRFKGTGWKVSDVRISNFQDLSSQAMLSR